MKTEDFNFDLPEHLIAQYPLEQRAASKLLHYDKASQQMSHLTFSDIIQQFQPHDVLVLNNTKVIPARVFGQKQTGGKLELLVERILSSHTCTAHIKASKALKPDHLVALEGGYTLKILEKKEALYTCELMGDTPLLAALQEIGHVPLPLYIHREDEASDASRYQTVYGQHPGSVAAPTAGLHFDEDILNQLKQIGVRIAYVTLHIGAGTFQPVRVEEIQQHQMHYEWYEISQDVCDAIAHARKHHGRVIAVGTTSMRTLESAAKYGNGVLKPHAQDTNLFIYPGFEFQVCDGLLTNFHLPKSSLIMLVAAFIGHKEVMALYQTAIDQSYRFFSYGDATLLL